MTQFRGTPGPWCKKLELDEDGEPVQWIVFKEGDPRDIHIADLCVGIEPIGDEQDATASLIAAAPALLEALERTLNWLSSYPGGGTMGPNGPYEQARAAISQALGEQ